MSWNVLINTQGIHFKFWSAELDSDGNYTGLVRFGVIGTEGSIHMYDSHYEVNLKIREKMNRGYEQFSSDFPRYTPSPSEAREGRPSSNTNTNESSVSRANQTINNVRDRANIVQTSQQEINYKTNRQGFIKKFPEGYHRPYFDNYLEDIKIQTKRDITNVTMMDSAKEYYNHIPSSHFKEKYSFDRLTDAQLPTFFFVFKKRSCIGVISFNRSQGIVDLFAIKTDTRNRLTLTRYVLNRIGFSSRNEEGEDVIFKLKNVPSRKLIKEAVPFINEERGVIKIKINDLRTRIDLPKTKPKRWLR